MINKYDLGVKCTAVVASCETPEHMACAIRYIKLASKVAKPYGLKAYKDLQRLVHSKLRVLHVLNKEHPAHQDFVKVPPPRKP
mgnify:CR=1 FL=1